MIDLLFSWHFITSSMFSSYSHKSVVFWVRLVCYCLIFLIQTLVYEL